MSTSMDGKVVVVSGASMGVGRATAQRFGQEGATVVLLARRKLLLDEIAESIGPHAVPIVTDITSSVEIGTAFEQVAAQFGRIDVLVNSAGASRIRLIEEASDEDIAVTVNTNLIAPIYTTRAAIPLLRAAGGGDIMNISSEITLDHMPMMTLYAATKRGLNGFTEAMTHELRRESIRVTLVILGAVGDTGIYENFGPGDLDRAWPIWEADGYLTRMSGTTQLTSATVAEVLFDVLNRPRELMMDVVHVRPASS
ncbi:MAG TPA: SDR family oxidoreductase [Mycobacterium sp.]|jgi:NAD(P)-dependent dehydrogenase (short-subunit alcohol dehydrogenase family)|uniref:SDR family oxidoreductase n=1 Tax=Mycobacterium sp. TaxID=1785 RepID=UPI002F413EB1